MKSLKASKAPAIALALLSLSVLPAANAASASASITNFSLSLSVVDPTIWTVPSITFTSGLGSTYVSAGVDTSSNNRFTAGLFAPDSLSVSSGGAIAQSAVSGGSLQASALAVPYTVASSVSEVASYLKTVTPHSFYRQYGSFVLSANTRLTLNGTYLMEGDRGTCLHQCAIETYVHAAILGSSGQPKGAFDDALTFYSGYAGARSGTRAGHFSQSFDNVSPNTFTGSFAVWADAYAYNDFGYVATPVPEVETSALMLAGLCALGVVRRRAKR